MDWSIAPFKEALNSQPALMDWFEDHIEKRSGWYVALASLLYFGVTAFTAFRRPFWYDELFTFHLARQGQVSDVLRSLANGADIHPPLDYLLRHFSMSLLGVGELPDRLPSILAFWVMCLSLRRFVSSRCGALLGLVAFLAPLSTLAYEYAYEGRAYALMLAGSALALAGWQGAADGTNRRWNLVVMGLGVAVAVIAHYYGCLVLIPLVAGEAVRAASRRRMDGFLALVLIGASSCFLLNWPYLRIQMAQIGTFWNQANLTETIDSYAWMLNPGGLAAVVFLGLVAVVCALGCLFVSGRGERPKIPVHEWAAAVAMLLVPVACYLIAHVGPGVFTSRYMLSTILGVILVASFVAHQVLGDAALRTALLMAVALAGSYQMVKTQRESAAPYAGRVRQVALESMIPHTNLPLVHGTRTGFMDATRYGSAHLFPRMFYLTSREASLKWVGNDNGQIALSKIAPLVPGRVVDYGEFLASNRRFVLLSPRVEKDWILRQLIEDGARIRTLAVSDRDMVFEVEMPE